MSLLSSISLTTKDIRLVPPTNGPSSGTDGSGEKDTPGAKGAGSRAPHLMIQSYNRFVPPDPTPDLEFDCRVTQNPARELRRSHTGADHELQNELMNCSDFSNLLLHAEAEIRKMMEIRIARSEDETERVTVRVGCLCGSGHHRSPALAELLGEIEWPSDWEVDVEHRDLDEATKKEKRRYLENSVAVEKHD